MTENKEIIGKIKRTDSFRFVFPMLSDNINDFVDRETLGLQKIGKGVVLPLVNCYIADKDIPEYNNHIFVLYRFVGTKEFGLFEESLTKHPCYVEMYNPTTKHDMFVFDVPPEYQLEYDLFTSERPKIYRRFSDEYKKRIISFLTPMFNTDDIASILYSDEARFKKLEKELSSPGSKVTIPRDIDNYPIPILENETFDKIKFL